MTDPTSRAVASVAIAAGFALIAFAHPPVAVMAVLGLVGSIYLIWEKR